MFASNTYFWDTSLPGRFEKSIVIGGEGAFDDDADDDDDNDDDHDDCCCYRL